MLPSNLLTKNQSTSGKHKLALSRTGGGLLALVFCAGALSAGTRGDAEVAVLQSVLSSLAQEGEHAWIQGRDKLRGVGPSLTSAIFAVLAGRIELVGEPQEGETARPLLDQRSEGFLREVLADFPSDQVAQSIRAELSPESPLEERWVAVRILGDCGNRESIQEIFTTLDPVDEIQIGRPYVRATVEEALQAILQRDPGAHVALREELEGLAPRFLPCVIAALGRNARAASIELLLDLLGSKLDRTADILAALGQPDQRDYDTVFEDCARAAQRYAACGEPSLERCAIGLMGRMRDPDAIEYLLDRWQDSDAGAQRTILQALREIRGSDLGKQAAHWQAWAANEMNWWQNHSSRSLLLLHSDDVGKILDGLGQVAAHPLFRRRLFAEVIPALSHPNEVVVHAACVTLEQLNDPGSLPALIDVLSDDRTHLREAAYRALRKISQLDLPPEPEAWSRWLLL